MLAPSVFKEIRENPTLRPHLKVVVQFLAYLRHTENVKFRVHGEYFEEEGQFMADSTLNFPYMHRWKDEYRKGVLAKFYQLEDWFKENPSPITMLTLTTFHDTNKWGGKAHSSEGAGITIPESFDLLKHSWDFLRDALRYYLPHVPFVWIMEPHKSGYPHLHVVLFADVDERTQNAIRALWSKKYKAGSFEHGVDFVVSKPEGGIKSIRNYLMKYIVKGFTKTGSKFGEVEGWSAGELVFNALVWKNKWRLFGASRDLCKVMAYHKKPDEKKVKFYATEILNDNGENHPVWLLQEPTGWGNHTRLYREIPKPVFTDEKNL